MKKKILLLVVGIVLLFVVEGVLAQPSITSAPPSVVDGGSVSISGNGFGTNALDIEWTGNNIEAGTDGNKFSKNGWSVDDAGTSFYPTKYTTAKSHSGSKSLISQYPEKSYYGSGYKYNYGSEFGTIYATWWSYFDHVDSPGQWKKWRLNPTGSLNNEDGEIYENNWFKIDGTSYQAQLYLYCDHDDYSQCYPGSDSGHRWISGQLVDSWVRTEVYAKESSGAGIRDGTLIVKRHKEGEVITSVVDWEGTIITRVAGVSRWRYWMFQNYWGNQGNFDPTGPGDKEKIYTDDIFIQFGTQARVEIGDNPNWNSCTHREIQIPTAWSGNSITFTVNQGSFHNGEAYLFVVDENGEVSTGYPISFGGTPTYECNDGLDNDGDGATDLADNGCSSSTDNDETNCGDGVCEGSESCSSCASDCGCVSPEICCNENCITPPSCDDEDSCTTDSCTDYGTCNPSCQNIEITSCVNNDGCCPSGCTYSNDNDCSVECLVDSDCVDVDCKTKACTDNQCVYQDVGCQDNDGCCPSACTLENDDDCIVDYCSNLALLMHFDEDSSTAQDFSGNGNNGTVSGATFTSLGKFDGAFEFDGDDDYVTINDDSTLDITDELTLGAWVYPTTITDWDYIISKAFFPYGSPYIIYALGFYSDTERLRVRIFTDTSYQVLSNVITPNQWYHVVGTYSNSNNELNIYINGVLVNSTTATGQISTNDQDVLIGGYEHQAGESWNGVIDEVAVWNRALSSDEILNLYNSGGPISCGESLCGEADTNSDSVVATNELMDYISRWKNNEVSITELMTGIGEWKNGC